MCRSAPGSKLLGLRLFCVVWSASSLFSSDVGRTAPDSDRPQSELRPSPDNRLPENSEVSVSKGPGEKQGVLGTGDKSEPGLSAPTGSLQRIGGAIGAERTKLDSIAVKIYTPHRTTPIILTEFELNRPGIDGQMRTRDEIILEQLLFDEAQNRFHLMVTDEELNSYLLKLEKNTGFKRSMLPKQCKELGYTEEEWMKQFKILQTNMRMLEFAVKNRAVATDAEVRGYYDGHPEWVEAQYCLVKADVTGDKNGELPALEGDAPQLIEETSLQQFEDVLSWSGEFCVNDNEIASDKDFIKKMEVGEVYGPVATGGVIELFKLVSKQPRRLKTLESRYLEISQILRGPKIVKLMEEYKKNLLDSATIVYL